MTTKREARKIMRNIRAATGLPLPDAANAARKIATGNTYDIPSAIVQYAGGCDCCGSFPVGIEGPRGTISFDKARSLTPERRPAKPMPEKVRTVRVKLANVDAALGALRKAGVAAMIAKGTPEKGMVTLAVNTSGNKVHKILVAAKITPPISK